ncbi:iron(II)-dependent oxidoreductase [Nocardiopsis sp. Huas11]|uniref:glycosyltransferase n=1 Tax=Nocardiopsis sp. Huas11 TaxID=2183912 RepID=UPI000EAFFF54|nr:glycosyltransferase [Nocardiopsis sp. Huas11]RKS07038.1 iron(II)-dependent oxidoreductase [Nocardiopsis sp. Huas11]
MNIAFVLLTYGVNEPAGIERSIGALASGCRALGHRSLILTAASARGHQEGLVRLASVRLPRPATEDDLLHALTNPTAVCAEVAAVLERERVDLVCWADASWGLGYLAPAPPRVRTVLRVGVLRTDEFMDRALAQRPRAAFTCSPFLTGQARDAGLDTTGWHDVPDPLACPPSPVPSRTREFLRTEGPVRVAARAEPHKGIAELIDAVPASFDRPVEIALAPAAFEYWPGMQAQVIADCRERAARTRQVRIVPPLPWDAVQPFFAQAAISVNCSTSPETFGLAAAESLNVGTPVAHYALGHLPALIGPAGPFVPLHSGPALLWEAVGAFLDDRELYHRAARQAVKRVAHLTPHESARRFLSLTS